MTAITEVTGKDFMGDARASWEKKGLSQSGGQNNDYLGRESRR